MDPLERIRAIIEDFAGYAEDLARRLSDEQVRGYVGETLAGFSAAQIENLTGDARGHYDRALLRCEFINQDVFRIFDQDPRPERIAATLEADAHLVETAGALRQAQALAEMLVALNDAFDKRDAAMQSA